MNAIEAILLGLLQGVTEFLPVSSSAHLVAAQSLLGVRDPGATVEVALHFGTLASIIIVFWRDLWALARDGVLGTWLLVRGEPRQAIAERAPALPTALAVVIGTVPTGVTGMLLGDAIEPMFSSPIGAGLCLMVTGGILAASRWAPPPRAERVGPGDGFIIGLAQAAALLPGISRSGATISMGLVLGVERRAAGRFAFLLAVPATLGAAALKLPKALSHAANAATPGVAPAALLAGMLTAAVVGTVCLVLLMRVVERGRLSWFAAYCLPVGAAMALAGWLS